MKGISHITFRLLKYDEAHILERVAEGVFDRTVSAALASEFLSDSRHHLAVALDGDMQVVGMASAVHYVHPDKEAQLFINEVGVADSHQAQGVGARLIEQLLAEGKRLECTEAWVATEPDNHAARRLYEKTGGIKDPTPFVMYTFPLTQQGSPPDGRDA